MADLRASISQLRAVAPIYVATHKQRNANGEIESQMSKNQPRSTFADLLGILGSAIAIASAEENGRTARGQDLRRLGIDPVAYRKIRRF
jgi:hypothetical protein